MQERKLPRPRGDDLEEEIASLQPAVAKPKRRWLQAFALAAVLFCVVEVAYIAPTWPIDSLPMMAALFWLAIALVVLYFSSKSPPTETWEPVGEFHPKPAYGVVVLRQPPQE